MLTKTTLFNTKRSHLSLFVFLIILGILLVVFCLGAAFDLEISKSIWNGINHPRRAGSLLSDILCNIGFFLVFTLIISMVICSFVYKKEKLYVPVLCCIFGTIILIVFISLEHNHFLNILKDIDEFLYSLLPQIVKTLFVLFVWLVILTGAFLFSWFFVCKRVDKKLMVRAGLFLIIGGCIILLSAVLLKAVWSRPRPKIVMDGDIAFRPVWDLRPFECFDLSIPSEIRGQLKSFPSGHTANAMLTVLSSVSLTSLDIFKSKKVKNLYLFIPFAIVILVAFGRILGAYHFLTDVSGAMIIGLIVSFFMPWCYKKENGSLLW